MALFRSSPDKQLVAASDARDKLIARLSDAESAVTGLRLAAEKLALDGAEDSVLSAAEAKTRAMTDRTATLRAALTQSEAHVADLERERNERADRTLRAQTASEVELLARETVDAVTKFDAAAAALADCTARAAVVVYEAQGLNNFAGICRAEIPAGGDMVARLLRAHAEAVLAGHAAPTLATAEAPFVDERVVTSPTQPVFCLRSVKWTDAKGQQIAGQFTDAYLPPHLVARALKSGAVVGIDDARRKELKGAREGHPRASSALDLDAEPEDTVANEQDAHRPDPIFTVIDPGEPFVIRHKEAAVR